MNRWKNNSWNNCCCCCFKCEPCYDKQNEKCSCNERVQKYECQCCSKYDNQEYNYDNNYCECKNYYNEY